MNKLSVLTLFLVLVTTYTKGSTMNNEDYVKATALSVLKFEEGFRAKAYIGPLGAIHIGYGQKLATSKGSSSLENFSSIKVTKEHAETILVNKISKIYFLLSNFEKSEIFNKLDNGRKVVIISMVYQLGYLGTMEFEKFWDYLGKGMYTEAAGEMRDSIWAIQTPERVARHSQIIEGK